MLAQTEQQQQKKKALDEFAKIYEQIDREVNTRIVQVLMKILKSEKFIPSKGYQVVTIANRLGITPFLKSKDPEKEILNERLGSILTMLRTKLVLEGLDEEKYESW